MNMNTILLEVGKKNYKEALQLAEQYIYVEAYKDSGYNQSKAAKLIGVSRGTYRTKLAKFLK